LIAKEWMKEHRNLTAMAFQKLLGSLIEVSLPLKNVSLVYSLMCRRGRNEDLIPLASTFGSIISLGGPKLIPCAQAHIQSLKSPQIFLLGKKC